MNVPVLDGHEDPVWNPRRRIVEPPRPRQNALHPSRANELDLDVPAPLMIDMNGDGDVLEKLKVGALEVRRRNDDFGGRSVRGNGGFGHRPRRVPPRLGLDERPGTSGVDDRPGVELAEAVLVVEIAARGRHLPVGVVGVDLDGGLDAEMLHISPSEVGSARRNV